MGALCPESRDKDFRQLEETCYPCSVKITVVDSVHANLYGFSELVVISMSSVLGFRQDEDHKDRYEHVVSSHGFSPGDVPTRLFTEPECM